LSDARRFLRFESQQIPLMRRQRESTARVSQRSTDAMGSLRIKDWHKHFHLKEASKYETVTWMKFPVSTQSVAYKRLMAFREGRDAYCVFVALVQMLARKRMPGVLQFGDDRIDATDLAAATGIPLKIVSHSMKLLALPEIGWLQTGDARATPGDETGDARAEHGVEVEVRGESKRNTSSGVAFALNGSSRFPNANPDTTPGIRAAAPVTSHPHLEGTRRDAVKFLLETLTFNGGDKLHRKQRERLMTMPGCTPERVWWLCERIKAGEGKSNPATWLETGIDQRWALDGADEAGFRAWWDKAYAARARIESKRAAAAAGGGA
jgi:hypothetical protein